MIKVFTAFSGYDSQCLALNRLGIDYELVGWSEIDKYAIKAHDALFPQWAERNYGDISKVDWAQVPDFALFTYSSPCQDFSQAGLQRGGGKRQRNSLIAPMGVREGDYSQETQVPAYGKRGGSGVAEVHQDFPAVDEFA